MLNHTFIHVQGIGAKTEQKLWRDGISDWEAALSRSEELPPSKQYDILNCIKQSKKHMADRNPAFFSRNLPAGQHWRLYPEFKNSCAFIDIETTGLDMLRAHITTIALYDGNKIKTYINGRNLEDFKDDIMAYDMIVTYNGKTFDIPFIESFFDMEIPQAHIDLRYVLAGLGYKGGLKRCEKALGIDRGNLDGVDGFFAVLLWRDYRENMNEKALETLLAYNIEDVVNLETLMVKSYNLNLEKLSLPFDAGCCLPRSVSPRIPFQPDRATIEKLKYQAGTV